MGKIPGVIVVLVVVVGGAMYFMHTAASTTQTAYLAPTQAGTTTAPAETTQPDETAATSTAPASGSGTIASLMVMTGNAQCAVQVGGANPASGTIYVSAGKMHGDFTMTMKGKTMHAYMINDGTSVYSWSNMAPQGVKVAASAATAPGATTHGYSASTNVSYTCSPWNPDPSEFVPPTSVIFMALVGK